ncbi:MAG: rod shape-determining protein RodA [Candidatus Dactylopiibacterium carminicum]|uniref:Peptidoglycan glycosyltransferase MrdB n=2 Tax=Candidatus Dactylopiibacterium carminicum TaxID=857335 RepID=A0A272EWX3_9RHOO|nr:rod shape-determining protein RodA [Candidatus Dactylopiibacterium carminicum]PAS94605.1 MAG: rod shape-determining protein RodA [Candidatus Dactylopiibacterium carminicum]PAS97644.1 MAG: rod shape-determining protein RodA [Candidatus Dactylopiibacterium carminicum]
MGILGLAALMMLSASPERMEAQAINTGVALSAMWLVASQPPQRLHSFALPLYLLGVVLLIAVKLFGEVSKGAQRWLDIGITRIQPSELMKIAMPLMLAWYFQKREGSLQVRDFLVAALLLAMPVALILKQPDLGTALLVLSSGLFVIYFAGLSWKLIVPVVMLALIGVSAILVYQQDICVPDLKWPGLHDYQKHRVCTLLDPSSDPRGKGFHTIQSTIAIGSGGVLGKGWRDGTQTHLDFLPERHTDFILAVISEELGLIGVIGILLLYCLLIARGLMIAANAPNLFSRLLAGAITMIFFTYAFVNMGMVAGILPIVGVPLPMISYGGTALVTLCLGCGILMSIQGQRRRA